jgi:hypothetical protein
MKYEFLAIVNMKVAVSNDRMPCCLIGKCQHFGEARFLTWKWILQIPLKYSYLLAKYMALYSTRRHK